MKQRHVPKVLIAILMLSLASYCVEAARFMENLDRGVVAVYKGGGQVYIGWRMFGTEPDTVGYNVYRNSVKINGSPITGSTNYIDTSGSSSYTYRVAAVIDGVEQDMSDSVSVWSDFYHDIPLQRPAGGTTPDAVDYTYSPNDASVADLDGDGQYEIVLKWDPSNSKDNANGGYSGNVYLDAYEMDGTFLWRIDLGINIRAGAHYTQFMVYDFDSDGKAEVVCKTAEGTVDGVGTVLGNPSADYRNSSGYILSGPEYLSVFDGQTGAFVDTVDYVPPRGNVSDWGDSYGNRVDRFLACVAYLDGQRPSVVMCRGYYTRTVLAAWDFVGGQLTQRWVFDSDDSGNSAYAGQGNHNLSVADVDADGKDEIIYGSCTIDDDGTGLYTTGLGHGDAMHVSDMDPGRPGLEVWQCHEGSAAGATFRDAETGAVLIDHYNSGDVGRACAANIDSGYFGYQLWSYATGGVYSVDNVQISANYSGKMMNFLVWWTGDLQREFQGAADGDGKNPVLEKWGGDGPYRLLSLYSIPTSYSTNSNNWSKANPCLSGDILGDWREEMIFRSSDNTKLRIFTTTELTSHRIYTLMHDPQYRLAMAWQNVAYNQPPHPSFYIGAGMSTPPIPNIVLVGAPVFTSDPINLDAVELSSYAGQSLANYASDLNGMNTVTFSKDGGPDWLTVASDGALSGIPSDRNVGENTFTVRVTDTGGLSDTATMTIQVANIYSGVLGTDDLLGLAAQWLSLDCVDVPACNGADLDGDDDVTVSDFSVLAHNWLGDEALQLHLKFNETSGDTAYDNSIYWRPGTLVNAPAWDLGHSGGALLFDGTNDHVEVSGYQGIPGGGSRTCMAWVKTASVSGEILTWGEEYNGGRWVIRVDEGGQLRAEVQGGNIIGTTVINNDTWHHVAVVITDDGSPDIAEAQLYVDGQLETISSFADEPINSGSAEDVKIGAYLAAGGPRYFQGLIDEVRIYDTALTQAEIAVLAQ